MKTINRKPLFLALAGITALGAVGTAQAVNLSPGGLGQVLLYPYYTVNGSSAAVPYNTLLSIVNSTNSTKAVKVRFREGKASEEVLDFNLFLSPYDVWTASLEPNTATGGVTLFTADRSCTIPAIPATGVDFRNSDYTGDNFSDDTLGRLREGYAEVIEMATFTADSSTATNAKHAATGIPKDCATITTSEDKVLAQQKPVAGGLTGSISLVAPGSGFNSAVDPIALDNFRHDAFYQLCCSSEPELSSADPFSVSTGKDGVVYANWTYGEDAVSAVLMKANIINEFVLDTNTNSATNWVVTMPTKHFYGPFYTELGVSFWYPPFQGGGGTASCDTVQAVLWNREEAQSTLLDFSPQPKTTLCWETNVITFNGVNLFGSTNVRNANTTFANGWGRIGFTGSRLLVADSATVVIANGGSPFSAAASTTFTGLPVIGFAVQTFRVTPTNSYAGTFYHRSTSGSPGEHQQ